MDSVFVAYAAFAGFDSASFHSFAVFRPWIGVQALLDDSSEAGLGGVGGSLRALGSAGLMQ